MDGFFLINKPKSWSSYDVIRFFKKKFGFKKIGHAGTLDPLATGLLVVLLGRYTKKFSHFQRFDKEYEAVIHFGIKTDTYDKEGKIIFKYKKPVKIDKKQLLETLKSFEGEIFQKPPIYSAVKIKGKPAYKLALAKKKVELKARKRRIKEIKLRKFNLPEISLLVVCSSGTYLRSLANDIGEKLGFGAYLEELERTRIGEFNLKEAKLPQETSLSDLRADKI